MVKAFWYFFFLLRRLGVLRFNLISLALVPARKEFIDENKLTFTKPLDQSLNNHSYGRNGDLSLKNGLHILSKKLKRKYKCFWCFTWLSLVEIGVSNFALIRPKIVLLPEINCWKLEYLAHLTKNRYEYFRNFFSTWNEYLLMMQHLSQLDDKNNGLSSSSFFTHLSRLMLTQSGFTKHMLSQKSTHMTSKMRIM